MDFIKNQFCLLLLFILFQIIVTQAEDDIVELLAQDIEAEDQYIRYKALIKLREDNDVKFKDKKYEEEYKEYCDQVNGNI